MKKILLLSAVCLLGLYSCQKDNLDSPGKIQGLGNTPGEIKVQEVFTLPEGIHLLGDITGIENPSAKSGELKPVYDAKSGVFCYGSGKYVRLKLTLLNSRNNPRTIFFPKGLLWKCLNNEFQTGLQCQTTWVCLPANGSKSIYIDLYCCNSGISAPDQSGNYKILGVTSSRVLWDLLNTIGWRKINFEMIYSKYLVGKGEEGTPTYEEIVERMQTIVWNLTNNGIALSNADKSFIESIPELSSSEIPVVDANSQFPEYFEEFVVSGK